MTDAPFVGRGPELGALRTCLPEAGRGWGRVLLSEHTFYRWKAKYGGLEVSDTRRLKTSRNENRRLKTLVADLTLDNQS